MQTLQYSIIVEASREQIWKTMLNDATYRCWTAPFCPNSRFEGDWSEGSIIRFLGEGPNGEAVGMVSRIIANEPYAFISIEHQGLLYNGVEDTKSDKAKAWAGAQENYTLEDLGHGQTKVLVDVDSDEEYADHCNEAWRKALSALKQLAEQDAT